MLGYDVEMSLIFYFQILGSLVLGWAPNHFVLGAQLAPGEKRLVLVFPPAPKKGTVKFPGKGHFKRATTGLRGHF